MPESTSNSSINYGTVQSLPRSARRGDYSDGRHANQDDETAGLLGKPSRLSLARRLHRHMSANVSTHWTDLILLVNYFITGLLDSSSVLVWGSFASMQTGNTIYLGHGLVDPTSSDRWVRSLISIGAFMFGSFFFARMHRILSPRRRATVAGATTLQVVLIAVAAIMVTVGPRGQNASDPVTVWLAVPLALVAFQAAGQAVLSRVVHFNSLSSVVLTSIYCDLVADPELFSGLKANAERNRRVAAPLMLLVGAFIGGVWAHTSVGMMGALWTAATVKFGTVIAWLCWAAGENDDN